MKIIHLTFLLNSILIPNVIAQNRSVERIDWEISAKLPPTLNQQESIGLAGAASGIHNGALIVGGGTNFPDKMPWLGGKKHYYDLAIVYPNIKAQKSLTASPVSYKLPFNLAYAATCSTEKGIVLAGGENEKGLSSKVLILNWKPQDEILTIQYLPDLPFGITNASLTIVGKVLYLAGGEVPSGAKQQFLTLNLEHTTQGWTALTDLPNACSHAVLLGCEKSGQVYLVGGRSKAAGAVSEISDRFYAYDIKKDLWKQMPPLPFPLSAASGVIAGDDILIFSGDVGETFNKAERLIIAIENEKDEHKKEILNKEKATVQSTHPGFSKKMLKFNLFGHNWRQLNNQMPYGTVTVNAVVYQNQVFIAGGEIRAGVRTPNILTGKLKFTK
ncbi:hypothetical protein [Pedobacter endophyticus]|uniref:Cyclically-permuted mutarotase family protein n=1 Tax=Pedobacter endophyticus TaxID=2789740 RepID=A0A7S9L1N5_9SPHI|nr:hypothetical protein [Pedobacter endophyticus]QPH40564.1 hypothetical protein IZT61_04600 [Pedobacter endophyticus]